MRRVNLSFASTLVSVKPVGHKILYLWPLRTSVEAHYLESKEIPTFGPVDEKGKPIAFESLEMAGF